MIDAPASASARGYLTATLPAVYTESERSLLAALAHHPAPEPFVVRWLRGLEEVLDPTVTLLDNLAWHLDTRLCPDDVVAELLRWLGLEAATHLDPDAQRGMLRRAMALGRRRGTLAGLRELLGHAFGGLRIEVTHSGRATQGADPHARPQAPPPRLVVQCPATLTAEQEDALRSLIDYGCPAHVDWTLRTGGGGPQA
jgi:phage tail-like protein